MKDIVIIGAGPIGAAMALGLIQQGFRITLVEQQKVPKQKIGETLPPEIKKTLQTLGLWDIFLDTNPEPFPGLRTLWGKKMTLKPRTITYPAGQNGWYIHRKKFEKKLISQTQQAGCLVLSGQRFIDLKQINNKWQIILEDHPPLNADYIIDCSGRSRVVGRKLKSSIIQYEHLLGLAGFFHGSIPANTELLLETTPNGWWYSAPFADEQLVGVFITHYNFLKHNMPHNKKGNALYEQLWQDELVRTKETQIRFSNVKTDTDFQIAPAGVSQMEPCGGSNWLAVGDAAMTVDPACAYGLYIGLNSCVTAIQAISNYLKDQSTAYLELYHKLQQHLVQQHLLECQKYYGNERRWPKSEFWKDRYQNK